MKQSSKLRLKLWQLNLRHTKRQTERRRQIFRHHTNSQTLCILRPLTPMILRWEMLSDVLTMLRRHTMMKLNNFSLWGHSGRNVKRRRERERNYKWSLTLKRKNKRRRWTHWRRLHNSCKLIGEVSWPEEIWKKQERERREEREVRDEVHSTFSSSFQKKVYNLL